MGNYTPTAQYFLSKTPFKVFWGDIIRFLVAAGFVGGALLLFIINDKSVAFGFLAILVGFVAAIVAAIIFLFIVGAFFGSCNPYDAIKDAIESGEFQPDFCFIEVNNGTGYVLADSKAGIIFVNEDKMNIKTLRKINYEGRLLSLFFEDPSLSSPVLSVSVGKVERAKQEMARLTNYLKQNGFWG